jgi:hypothetical protein
MKFQITDIITSMKYGEETYLIGLTTVLTKAQFLQMIEQSENNEFELK